MMVAPFARRRLAARAALLALAAACAAPRTQSTGAGAAATAATAAPAPYRLDDREFWRLVTEMSEPGGFFRSDNFVSNETQFQWVIPELQTLRPPGGVYFGVGPEQNLTYIVALQPRVAFIVDIRRQNMIQHLLYKALIEMSADRAEFASRLFARPKPGGMGATASARDLLVAVGLGAPDTVLFQRTLNAVKDRLTKTHGFALTPEDMAALDYVYGAFYDAGPDLTYSSGRGNRGGGWGRGRMPSFGQLMALTDRDGVARSFLATEANYQTLRELESANRIVPLVGDFAGPRALRAMGQWVRDQGATVSVFYLSNVEQYLFQQDDDWSKFFTNVATFPLDSTSTFIRSVPSGFRMSGMPGAINPTPPDTLWLPGPRLATMLAPIGATVQAFSEGRLRTYFDVIQMSR